MTASFAEQREHMLRHHLRQVRDVRVLGAMGQVPREEFVPEGQRARAYGDHPLPIGLEQTISQPFVVAFMAELARLDGSQRVLEVGTGSGYGAAVLSHLAREVWTVERHGELADRARARLARLGYDTVHVITGDGSKGLAEHAPYDAILVTAAAEVVPREYLEQLAEGGRLVIPVGPAGENQRMYRLTRRGEGHTTEDLGPFRFVPLVVES